MDKDRKIRFLVSPLFFVASLLLGLLLDRTQTLTNFLPCVVLDRSKLPLLVALLAGGGIVVFTLGYVIGTTTYVILRVPFMIAAHFGWGSGSHEIALSDESLGLIWRKVGAPGEPDRSRMFFAGTTFDHDILQKKHKGVHRWIVRRWNAFSIAATSVFALLLSLGVGKYGLRIRMTCGYLILVTITCVVLGFEAYTAWRDTMGMLNFQARRQETTE